MEDREILSQMIKEAVLVPLEDEYGKPMIKLDEPNVKNSMACIRNSPSDAFVIKADEFPAPKNFFKGDKGECKRADFIIISPEKKVILYVELKAGAKDSNHIVKQLKGAACVVTYCTEIGKQFWNQSSFLNGYSHRYIGIVNLSVNKKTSRHKKAPVHDTPETFFKISSPHNIQFREISRV